MLRVFLDNDFDFSFFALETLFVFIPFNINPSSLK